MPCLEYAVNAPGPADFSAEFSQLFSEPDPEQQFGRDLRTDSVLNRQMSASIWSLAVGKQKPSK